MMKFKGTFVLPVEYVIEFEIEAKSKEEALKKLERDPMLYQSKGEPIDEEQGESKEFRFYCDDENIL